jgi:pimeloyl-ACP methyl ester carboxylesterase
VTDTLLPSPTPEAADHVHDPVVRERPAWFSANLAVPYESCFVDVDGAPVHYRRWGDTTKPGLLFVHGGAANASWFTFLAPFFVRTHHVAAIDLSGMGDSSPRPSYHKDQFVADVLGVLRHSGMLDHPTKPVVVGHSMGGMVTAQLGRERADALLGVVICDVASMPRDPEAFAAAFAERRISGPPTVKKYYPTRDAALARYRLAPAQPCVNQYILDYLATESVHETAEGWTWKFDVGVFSMERPSPDGPPMDLRFDGIGCRAALVYGSRSHFADEATLGFMREETGGRVPIVIVPDAHHHLFIDQPLAFTAAVQAIVATWGVDG